MKKPSSKQKSASGSRKNQNAVELGRLGGAAGKGSSKARPREHYIRANEIRWAKTRGEEK
jgi:hypothetical protein